LTSFISAAAAQKACEERLREERSLAQQILAEAIELGHVGPKGLMATRAQVMDLFARTERLGGQVDKAFGGQAFLPNVGPASPANRRRFNAYLECHKRLSALLFDALELWALTCGMKMGDDWVPLVIALMHQQAAEARADASGSAGVKK
jgi:hypothetical protein